MRVRGIPGVTIYKPAARSGPEHKYLIAYEEDGARPVESVSADLDFTRRYAREVSRRVEMKRLGLITPAQERSISESKRRLDEHLDDYVGVLQGRGCTGDYVTLNRSRVRRVFEACSAEFIHELSPSRVQRAVGTMQKLNQKGNPDGPLSAQSRNHFLTAIVCFFTWLKQDGRIAENPFTDKTLRRFSVEADRKRVRRILSEHQLDELVRAADAGADWCSKFNEQLIVPGRVRGDVYRICLATGLRFNEVRTLTVADMLLDADVPGIRVSAKRAKNRQECVQHIKPSLAERLRKHVRGKGSREYVFELPAKRGAEMLRFDLAAAGIPYEDEDGRVFDFHALRYECGSLMVARGENLKVVQQHMRHCTITLTMDRYAKVQAHDQIAAVNNLPDFGAEDPDQQQLWATGTIEQKKSSAPVQRPCVSRRPGMSPDVPETKPLKLADSTATCGESRGKEAQATCRDRTDNRRFTKPALRREPAQTCACASPEPSPTSEQDPSTSGATATPISAPGAAHDFTAKKISRRRPAAAAPPEPPPPLPTTADLMEQIRLLAAQVATMNAARRTPRAKGGRG